MKTILKTAAFIALFLVAITLCSFSVTAKSAYEIKCENAQYADAVYFYSYDAKSVLYSKNEEKIIYPASTVKIMTGLIACEQLGNRLNETVTVTQEMLEGHSGTSMGLKVGMTLSVKDIIYGAICGGCNDAAQALAVIACGSLDAFVEKMNSYATELEMTSTVYKNPTGLDENGAQTTVYDIAILSKVAAKNSLYMQISSAKNYTYKSADKKDSVIYNRNALISHFTATQYLNEYANGLNAGSTEKGGYVVSTIAKSNGTTYLCIVMGAQKEGSEIYSYKITNELIEKAISTFGRIKISAKGEKISTLSVDCALSTDKEITVSCITDNDIYAYVPKNIDFKKKLEYRAYIHDTDLTAPINEGDVLGGLNIYLDGQLIGSARLISDKSIEENEFLLFMKNMKNFLLSRNFLLFVLILAPAISIFLYFDFKRKRRKRIGYIKF